MNKNFSILCLLRGHDLDATDARLGWADEDDVFHVYPYRVTRYRCHRCGRYVEHSSGLSSISVLHPSSPR